MDQGLKDVGDALLARIKEVAPSAEPGQLESLSCAYQRLVTVAQGQL